MNKPTFEEKTTDSGLKYIETECPGRGCVKPYRIDEHHPDFVRVRTALRRGDRSSIFCYHRART